MREMWKLVVICALVATRTAHADAGDRWDGVMILEQSGGAIAGGVVCGGVLMLAGVALTDKKGSNDWGAGLAGAAVGVAIGSVAGTAIGTKVVGDHRGGNGGWGATIAGSIGGGFLTVLTLSQYADHVPPALGIAFATITMIGPPIVAYHLSTDENNDVEKRVMVPLVLSSF
jgi:hypothetical protein